MKTTTQEAEPEGTTEVGNQWKVLRVDVVVIRGVYVCVCGGSQWSQGQMEATPEPPTGS